MKSTLDKLNLSAGERRLLVIVLVAVIAVLNFWLVTPHIFNGDLGIAQNQLAGARATLAKYEAEIAKEKDYRRRLRELEGAGATVATAEQALQLLRAVQTQAALSGVAVLSIDSRGKTGPSKPTDFFEEQTVTLTANTGDAEIIDFLYKLGSGTSLIRVRDMTLGPDATQYKLNGTLTLTESFQKAAPARAGSTGKVAAK